MEKMIKASSVDSMIANYDFEMYSKSGNNACRSLVKKIFKKIEGRTRITEDALSKLVNDEFKKVSKKHGEIYDTEPSYHIGHLINKKCKEVGYCFDFDRYF